jgi:hypothetical protein
MSSRPNPPFINCLISGTSFVSALLYDMSVDILTLSSESFGRESRFKGRSPGEEIALRNRQNIFCATDERLCKTATALFKIPDQLNPPNCA